MCIKHKKQQRACLLLLKGEHDDNLEWPIDLPYELEIGHVNTSLSTRRRLNHALHATEMEAA